MYQYKSGGETHDENKRMLVNQSVELQHHADELSRALDNTEEVDAWVIAKAERAATDLSDITHYLDGKKKSMLKGGETLLSDIDEKIRLFITSLPSALNEKGMLNVEYMVETTADYVFKIFSKSQYPVNRAEGKLKRAGIKVEKTGVSTEKMVSVPKALIDGIGKSKMAKGGVTYVDARKANEYQHYYLRFNNAIGSFAWKHEKSIHEGILYALSDFDRTYYAHLVPTLKIGEHIFRYRSTSMLPEYMFLIKINLDKSLIYFMDTEKMSDDDDKNIVFQSRGIPATYIVVQYNNLFPQMRVYAEGGMSEVAGSPADAMIVEVVQKVNEIKPVADYYLYDKQLVIITDDELLFSDVEELNGMLQSMPNLQGMLADHFTIGYKEKYKTLLLELYSDDISVGKFSHGGMTADEYMQITRNIKSLDDISVLEWANQIQEAHEDDEIKMFTNPSHARKFLIHYYTDEIEHEGSEDEEGDLFHEQENLPSEVMAVLERYEDISLDEDAVESMQDELERLGFTFDVGQDMQPTNLRKIQVGNYFSKGGNTPPSMAMMKSPDIVKMSLGGIAKLFTKYDSFPNSEHELKVQLYYDKGGMNYFSNRLETRGYYLSVSPVKRTRVQNLVTEEYTAYSGIKRLILPVGRRSDKSDEQAERLAESKIEELKNEVISRNREIFPENVESAEVVIEESKETAPEVVEAPAEIVEPEIVEPIKPEVMEEEVNHSVVETETEYTQAEIIAAIDALQILADMGDEDAKAAIDSLKILLEDDNTENVTYVNEIQTQSAIPIKFRPYYKLSRTVAKQLKEFDATHPNIVLYIIADDVADTKLYDISLWSQQNWATLSDEKKAQFNYYYRALKFDIKDYLVGNFISDYYNFKIYQGSFKGASRRVIDNIARTMKSYLPDYPQNLVDDIKKIKGQNTAMDGGMMAKGGEIKKYPKNYTLNNNRGINPKYNYALIQVNKNGDVFLMGNYSNIESAKSQKLFWEKNYAYPNEVEKFVIDELVEKKMADGGMMAKGGEVSWRDAEYGDNALVISENRMGIIVKPYGRKFHLRFVDGSEKTYDAKDLRFFKDEDEYADGGMMAKGGVGEPYDNMTKYELEKEYKKLNEKKDLLKKRYGSYQAEEITEIENEIDKIITLLYGKNFSGVGRKFYYADGGMMAKGGRIDDFNVIVRLPKGLIIKRDLYGMTKKEIIKWCEDRGWKYNPEGEIYGGRVLKDYEFFVKKATYYKVRLPNNVKLQNKAEGGMMAKGGATFEDKVRAISMRLEGSEVPRRLRGDYGKRYNREEAKMAAKRIAGAMRAKE